MHAGVISPGVFSEEKKVNCPGCGVTLHPNSQFCPNCGQPVPSQLAQMGSGPLSMPGTQLDPGQEAPQGSPHTPQPPASLIPSVYTGPGVAAYNDAESVPGFRIATRKDEHFANMETHPLGAVRRPDMKIVQSRRREGKEESENERLLIFSDAIIAFAITITAVPLKVAKGEGWIKLLFPRAGVPTPFSLELTCYILGFFLIYSLWRDHHSIFHHIKRNNNWLIALNVVFLAMIALIPVGFIFLIIGFGPLFQSGVTQTADPDRLLAIGSGMLLFLGAQFCAYLILLLIWWSARARPQALFGESVPEKAFQGYMSLRLVFHLCSFLTFTVILFLLVFQLWLVALGLFVLMLGVQWLVLGLYRRRHRDVLDLSLGSQDTMRLQLFSDAIFAIAITITVAQIDPGAPGALGNLADVFSDNASFLGTYVFSFLILVMYWLLHYRVFHAIRHLNTTLVLLNFWFLLLIVLAFIPARLYTGNTYNQDQGLFHIEGMIFSLYQFATAGLLCLLWLYAQKHRHHKTGEVRLLKPEVTAVRRKHLTWVICVSPCIFLALAAVTYGMRVTPIFYVTIYLVLMGLAWLLAHVFVRDERVYASEAL